MLWYSLRLAWSLVPFGKLILRYLDAIAKIDRKAAETYLRKECYDSVAISEGGL